MNFVNLIGLISTIAGKSYSPQFNFQLDFRALKKNMGLSFLRDLPEFSSDEIQLMSTKALSGTVVIRPLDILGGTNLEYHYGIVLGTSISGEELILEMTKGRDVNIVTKDVFLSGFQLNQMQIYGMPKGITRDEIILRANKYQFDIYSLLDLNCKDFALYCAYLIEPKKRSDDLLKFCLESNKVSLSYWQWIADYGDDSSKKLAIKMKAEMEMNKKLLEKRLQAQ